MNIYNEGTYLKHNANWHREDSPYKANLVAGQLGGMQARSVIEVGCGAGEVISILSERFPDIQFAGYDVSRDAAGFWAGKESANLKYSCSDLLDSDKQANVVLCLDVFEHVEDYMGFLKRLSSHGAYFIFNVPMDMCVMKLLSGGLRYAREEVGHLHYFNEWSAKAALSDCGYRIETASLSAAFLKVPPRNLRQILAAVPRIFAHFLLGRHLACKLLGGYGLIIKAKAVSK
ncbi:MAG: class I SAM-dependent methyltransferase [Gallionella sp.]